MAEFPPTPEQQAVLDAFATGRTVVIEAGAGAGKTSTLEFVAADAQQQGKRVLYVAFNRALRDDQPVLTPQGWRAIGSLCVGEEVLGRDGLPHRITKVHPLGVRPLLEVEFSDGTTVVADEEHLWLTQTITYDARRQRWKVRTTREIADTIDRQHRLPHLTAPAAFPRRDLPLDPYLLGALLGDGSFRNAAVLFSCVEPELAELVGTSLPDGHSLNAIGDGGRLRSWTITGRGGRGGNEVLNALRALGLHGHGSRTKFVPEPYLFASAEQRLALLQGLMDTDGCASGPRALFRTTSKALAEAVIFLAQSLGGVATVDGTKQPKDGAASYLVNVRLQVPLCPFRLPRKVTAWRPRTRDEQTPRKITAVRPVAADRATCISIDADDHLFLTAGCVPTHNSIATEAASRFPANTTCSTAHSIAWHAGGKFWGARLRMPRQTGKRAADALGVTAPVVLGKDVRLTPAKVGSLALRTVKAFCSTPDREITAAHVPQIPGCDTPESHAALVKVILPLAEAAWADLSPREGKLRYTHDYYFKRWQLSGPRLDYDVIMIDEAQDVDPVLAAVIKAQTHAQLVIVGDRCQSIYAWRGSADIMGDFPDAIICQLTKSFRFGPAIAAEANRWLTLLDAGLRMVGHDPVPSTVGPVTDPDAILCRTNGGAVAELLKAHEAGRDVALVGDGRDIREFAEAALRLQEEGWTSHPELQDFVSWGQVQMYVLEGDVGSEDLKVAVKLIDDHGAETVIEAIDRLVPEDAADVVISTAHKAKGREWNYVLVGSDFRKPRDGEDPDQAELMLAYVTVTRARLRLDRGSLAWIDDHLTAPFQAPATEAAEPEIPAPATPADDAPAGPSPLVPGTGTYAAAAVLRDLIARAAAEGVTDDLLAEGAAEIVSAYLTPERATLPAAS